MRGYAPVVDPALADELLRWFDRARRDLPWREARTPYRVWVAETMLQQTRAKVVVPYYRRWLELFPTVAALAAAPEQEVLKAWEGLGYYRRARALHRAARELLARRGGELPSSAVELRELPGVGPYTAAAVAALAFGERVVAVDGNVRRVGARLFGQAAPRDRDLAERLATSQPEARAGDFAEALIELGATVCTPRSPRCGSCPLRPECRAAASGRPERFPAPTERRPAPALARYAWVHARGGALWLRRRDESEMLGGLWGFPQRDEAPPGERLPAVRHAYTHLRLTLVPVLVDRPPSDGRPVPLVELGGLPLSRVDHRVLARLRAHEDPGN